MKKIYMAPQVDVEKIEVESMLTGSETIGLSSTNYGGGTIQDKDDDYYDDDEEIW